MKLILTAALALAAPVVSAYVVTAAPSDFTAGSNLSEAFEGASLHRAGWGLDSAYMTPIYANDCIGSACDAPTNGKRVFSSAANPGSELPVFSYEEEFRKKLINGNAYYGSDIFLAQFDNATNFVEVTGQSSSTNAWYLDIWSTEGQLLGGCSNTGIYGGSDGCTHIRSGYGPEDSAWITDAWTVSFQTEATNIGFISVGGWAGPAYVQKLAYGVPETTPLALFGAGLAGMALIRRRRTHRI